MVVRVIDLPTQAIVSAVEAGEVDLGLAYDLTPRPGLRMLAASEWQIGAILPVKLTRPIIRRCCSANAWAIR